MSLCIQQGLNAQAKGEVLLSRRNGAAEMHKQKRKYFSAGGVGQWKFFFWQLHGEAGTWWYQGVVRTSGADLRLEHSVVVQLCPQVDWLTCIRGSQLYERYKLASGESNGNLITLGLRGNKNDKLMLLYFPFLTVG